MKKYRNILAFCSLALTIIACEKAPLRSTELITPTDKAFIRIALYSAGTPAVMIKANDVKLNGNTTSGSSGYFPATVGFPDYAAVPANSTFKLSLPNTGTQNDSVVIFNSQLNVEAGKFYSLTLADTGVNRTAFAIEDQFLPQKDSFLTVRLINAMVGSTLSLIRVDSLTATDVVRDTVAKNIPYKGTSGFISVKTFARNPVSGFIRFRIVSSVNGKAYAASGGSNGGQIPPQALATGSKRSITYYAFGFENGTGTYVPGLSSHITNQ